MLKHKLTDVREKIKSLVRLEAELRGAMRNCNRELRLKRESSMRTVVPCSRSLTE